MSTRNQASEKGMRGKSWDDRSKESPNSKTPEATRSRTGAVLTTVRQMAGTKQAATNPGYKRPIAAYPSREGPHFSPLIPAEDPCVSVMTKK